MNENHYAAIGAAVVATSYSAAARSRRRRSAEAAGSAGQSVAYPHRTRHDDVEGHAGHAGISAGRDRRREGRSDARRLHAEVAGQSGFA